MGCGCTVIVALLVLGPGPTVVITFHLRSITSCIRDVLVDVLLVAPHRGLLATAQMALWNTGDRMLAGPAGRRKEDGG
jgi:hypothetical protein